MEMSKTTDYRNRVFNPATLAVKSTEVGIEVKDNCHFFNPSYENLATTEPNDKHQYEDPAHVRNQILANRSNSNGTLPRRKRNEVYESTSDLSPLKRTCFPRSRHTDTECSEDSTSSTDVNFTRDSCTSRLVLFLVLAVSVTSLLLVILMMRGIIGQSCGCIQKSKGEGNAAEMFGSEPLPNVESKFEEIISELMKNVSNLQTSLISKDKRIDQLEARLSAQDKKIANFNVTTKLVKNATVEGVWVEFIRRQQEIKNSLNKLGSGVVALNATVKRLEDEKRQVVETLKSTDGYLNRTVKLLHEEDSKIDSSLQNKLSAVSMEVKALEQKVYNVSKINGPKGPRGFNGSQGPQGPKGAGNLSQCEHKEVSSSQGSQNLDIYLMPKQNEVIMGVTCSSDVRALKVFKHISYDAPANRYRCGCTTDESHHYKCVMHYWSCPKSS